MSGWNAIVWSVVVGSSALLYLKVVADEIRRTQRSLALRERRARREHERRSTRQASNGEAANRAA